MSENHTDQLFAGILQGAQEQAKTILSRAEQDAEMIRDSVNRKIAAAVLQEQQAGEKRIQQIHKLEESTIRNLNRRHEVSSTERLRKLILESVARKMSALVDTPQYRHTLVSWIAEAVVGLDRSEALVSCSFRERVDESMLREAEALVKRTTGKQVHLKMSDTPLTGQGVEVSSPERTVAFNNQVATRLIRYERELKELMEGQPCRKE